MIAPPCEPLYVVGISLNHAQIWSSLHVKENKVRPIFVSPTNVEKVFRGVRDKVVIVLKDAYIPEEVLIHCIRGRNLLIELE